MRRLLVALAALGLPAAAAGEARPLPLRVTTGQIERLPSGLSLITHPKVRAVAPGAGGDAAELRFRFLGQPAAAAPLACGQVRRQLGLKLRAQDGCNVLYVMWQLDPTPRLAIEVKRNAGKSRSAECGPHGYRKLPVAVPLPALAPDDQHALAAALTGDTLEVRLDGKVVWRGPVGPEVAALAGPVGLRTDNVMLAFQLVTEPTR